MGELCFDASSAHFIHARTRVRPQGIKLIIQLLRTVPIVGVNELHPAHHRAFDAGVVQTVPFASFYGSVGGNVIFWCRPQRWTQTGGGWQSVRGGQG